MLERFLIVVPGICLFMRDVPLDLTPPLAVICSVGIAFAIIQYRPFDIEVTIKRSVVYTTVIALIGGLYGLLIALFNFAFQGRELSRTPLFPILFVLVIVLLLDPLRNRLHRLVEKAFYKKQHEYRRALQSLSEAMTSLLDLSEILDRLLLIMDDLVGARTFSVLFLDESEESFSVLASSGANADERREIRVPASHQDFRILLQENRPWSLRDYERATRNRHQPSKSVNLFRRLECCLIIPLLSKGTIRGLLALGRRRSGGAYTRQDLVILKTLASQAAISIENARSLKALERTNQTTRQRAAELSMLYEAGTAIASTKDIDGLCRSILKLVTQHLSFERASILLADQDRKVLTRFRGLGGPIEVQDSPVQEIPFPDPEGSGFLAELVCRHRSVLVDDAKKILPDVGEEVCRLISHLQTSAFVAVPLVFKGRCTGVLVADRGVSGDRLTGEDLRLMETLANQIAVSIENAKAFQMIERMNRELEERVRRRTEDLHRANKRLEETAHHKSEFLASMSHELRTPLNSILGFTALGLDGIYGELQPAVADAFQNIKESGEHLLALINDVLDLSKIEAGRMGLSLAEYSPESCVEAAVSLFEKRIAAKGLRLSKRMDPSLLTGYGDEKRITQVLTNLVSNAVKFTPEGSIEVGVDMEENSHFLFRVADSGIGIPPCEQENIFKEFSQLDGSITKEHSGTGLGLSLSRKLVEMHEGEIWVESEPGRGSAFYIRLPVRCKIQKPLGP